MCACWRINARHSRQLPVLPEPPPAQRTPERLANCGASLTANLPRHPATAHRRGKLLPQPLLDHRLPRHQREAHAVIEHRVAPAGEHDAAPVDAGHALTVGHRAMRQAGIGGNVLRGLRQLPVAGPQRQRTPPAERATVADKVMNSGKTVGHGNGRLYVPTAR